MSKYKKGDKAMFIYGVFEKQTAGCQIVKSNVFFTQVTYSIEHIGDGRSYTTQNIKWIPNWRIFK